MVQGHITPLNPFSLVPVNIIVVQIRGSQREKSNVFSFPKIHNNLNVKLDI